MIRSDGTIRCSFCDGRYCPHDCTLPSLAQRTANTKDVQLRETAQSAVQPTEQS